VSDLAYPTDLLYNSDHDWARIEGGEATFGITSYAQEQLGEIVFWDGAEVGAEVIKDQPYTELESVKAVSDVIAPLSGRILAVNEAAIAAPETINGSPYGAGWLVRVELSAPAEAEELLSAAEYGAIAAR
jgi:glycine cleavage system H protein